MIRKFLYASILISLVLIVSQVKGGNGTAAISQTTPSPQSTLLSTGSVEVRMSASATSNEVTGAILTLSSVEIYLGNGWSKMTMGASKAVDLKQVAASEQTVATTEGLNQGTYTQIRITIGRLDVSLQGGQATKASLSHSKITFIQNFTVTAKNPTVLVINIDPVRSIDDSNPNQITFDPATTLLYTSPGAIQIITNSPPQAEVGVAYKTSLVAIGGQRPYDWRITMGDLPPGLTFNDATGEISGTPTAAGLFGFTIRVDDHSATSKNTTRNFIVGVAAAGALQILTGNLPDGSQNGVYKIALQAVGGTKAYTWSLAANQLPAGLALDASTGVISGTATISGDATFVVKVSDSANPANTDTQMLTLHIGKQVVS